MPDQVGHDAEDAFFDRDIRLSVADKALTRIMLQRIHSCLRNHRKHGRVKSTKSEDRKFST